jgi:hypothetical protein
LGTADGRSSESRARLRPLRAGPNLDSGMDASLAAVVQRPWRGRARGGTP